MNSKITIPIIVIVVTLIISGIIFSIEIDNQPQITQTPIKISYVDKIVSEIFNGTNEIRKISSQEELNVILEASSIFPRNDYRPPIYDIDRLRSNYELQMESERLDTSTHIQVENIDELDYVKNDSKYIYKMFGNHISIIDADPAGSAESILTISLDRDLHYIHNMFLNNDRLVILYNGQSGNEVIPQHDFIPIYSSSPTTHVLIIDISDNKENASIVKDYSIDGHFVDARMIGDYAYFVTNINVDYQHPKLPVIMEDYEIIMTPDAFYFDSFEQFSQFSTLTAIDIFGDKINSKSFLMAYPETFYASEDNFYLAYYHDAPYQFYENSPQDKFFNVIVPLLPKNIQEQIKVIEYDSSISSITQWTNISELIQKFYNEINKEDKDVLFDEIKKALAEYSTKIQENKRKTIIHKISIDKDKIEYVAQGTVPGRIINPFAMDESGDRFRIATTATYYTAYYRIVESNAVYVLDEQLNIVGELEKIAPDGDIFSIRFMDDLLYLSTFKQFTSFFVIDLSSDAPEILGELNTTGVLDYLYPYDDEHVIGIGRDAKDIVVGRIKSLGIQIVLFNVKDTHNPKIVDDAKFGSTSTYSSVISTPKAFFFDNKSKILSVPIKGSHASFNSILNSNVSASDNTQWDGFFIFDFNKEDEFSIKGTIQHSIPPNLTHYRGIDKRTFNINDVLYTVSHGYLKMNYLNDLKEINSIKLRYY